MPRAVLQISVPRGGSNAVARMLGQSPDVAAVLRSQMLESGSGGFLAAAAEVARRAPDRLLYVKEHAAFLTDDRLQWFGPQDRFLLVVRDPAQQLASAVLAVASNPQLLRKKLSERRRTAVGLRRLTVLLDRYADRRLSALPVTGIDGRPWQRLVDYVRHSHDFRPLARPLSALFRGQPEQEACESDVDWFDRSLFEVGVRSWTGAVRLAGWLAKMPADRVAVVDFTVLQARPGLVAEVCERLAIRYQPRMVSGPWRPGGEWFDAGLELAEGHRWVHRARSSTTLYQPRAAPYDPLTLPRMAREALLPSLASYLTLLRHPGFVGPRTEAGLRHLLDGEPGLVTGCPVTAWALATVRCGVDSALARSVEAVTPGLARFFATARQLVGTEEPQWCRPACTTQS